MNNVQITPAAAAFIADIKRMAETKLEKYSAWGWTAEDSGAVREMERILKAANSAL